jgi:CubicO group peptidase (beta-lactamase class C family)
MRKKLFLIACLLMIKVNLHSQTLTQAFNTIRNTHDMMGGSLVVFCENEIIENIAIGTADYTRSIAMTESSKYRIASISKTITAIAIMQLAEQNQINLDEDISNILGFTVQNPNFPNTAITTRMLLSHKSSIIDGSTYNNFLDATVNNSPIPDLSEILAAGGTYYTSAQFNNITPGTYFNYSNINYVTLGTIVEKISNQRFDIYCKTNIFEPLGIDASFNVNDINDIDSVAVLYRKPGGVWTPQADNFQGLQPSFNNLTNYVVGTNGGRFGPQGGLRCSAKDLAIIFQLLMNKGTRNGVTLLNEASCNAMFNNEWTYNGSNGNNYYGLFRSWGLGIHRITSTPGNDMALSNSTSMLGHTGEAYGLVSDAYFDTIRKVGFVFMNNGVGNGYQTNNNSIFYTIEQEVFSAIESYGNLATCLTSNTPHLNMNDLLLYPNPSGDILVLDNLISDELQILSLNGDLIKTINLYQSNKIDISDLASGTYLLRINNNTKKFVKM